MLVLLSDLLSCNIKLRVSYFGEISKLIYMKKLILLLFTFSIFCSSCSNDDDGVPQQEYKIQEVNDSGVSGSTFFVGSSFSDEVFNIAIQLIDVDIDVPYTAYLYNNSLSEGGEIVTELDDFFNLHESEVMSSWTNFDSSDQIIVENEVFDYQDLIAFDGHIKIFDSNDLSTPIAQGNIGSNAQ